jgi:adenylate kinase
VQISDKLVIILLGPPGSGKGTQAKLLCRKFNLEYFSSGEELRKRQKINDFTGKKLKEVMDRGEWVPETTIIKIWLDKLEEFKKKRKFNGMVYDGGPRKMLEAELFDIALKWYEWQKNIKVFFIALSEKEAFNRLTKRRQCKKCGELIPWLGEFKKVKRCPKCGGELIYRSDDKVPAIRKRLSEFKKHTVPVINYFKKQGKLIKINGEQSIEKVFQDILKALK